MFTVKVFTLSGMADTYECSTYEQGLDLMRERMENGQGVTRAECFSPGGLRMAVSYSPGCSPAEFSC